MKATMRGIKTLLVVLALIAPLTAARAHELADHDDDGDTIVHPNSWHDLAKTWGWEPGSIICLALSAALYARGLARYWRNGGVGRGVRRWQAACFGAGWLVLFIALVS